ncbi:MAG: hypothetical protein SF123_06575 [Chloroflexota bacterium]|nr:hypothetical protein [Chloroflexota bacterium]
MLFTHDPVRLPRRPAGGRIDNRRAGAITPRAASHTSTVGRVTRNVLPAPTAGLTMMRPPCSSTISQLATPSDPS